MPPQDNASRSGDEPDESLIDDATEPGQDATVGEMVSTDTDEWTATAQGYTPLADLGGGEAMFMAFPPSMDDDEDNGGASYPSGGGVFFADPSVFGATSSVDGPANSDNEEEVREEPIMNTEQDDFRALADQALSSLENEYSMTVRGENSTSAETSAGQAERASGVDAVASGGDCGVAEENIHSSLSSEALQSSAPASLLDERELPPIDTDAVRRAVASIRLKAPDLTMNLDKGCEKQREEALAPKEHAVIPSTPLAAFRRRSPKAKRATSNLSRSASLAEALCRLSCLDPLKKSLVIHVVGADPVECDSDDRVRTLFGPLVQWVGALSQSPSHISIQLVGPNLPVTTADRPPVNLLPLPASKSSTRIQSADASFFCGLYHEWMAQGGKEWQQPDLAVAFNAGVWGYNEWRPTLEVLCNASQAIPFVITSYTIQEAEDDADVVEAVLASYHDMEQQKDRRDTNVRLWGPEANPFASKLRRETASAVNGREYRENAAWQAWLLGRNDNS